MGISLVSSVWYESGPLKAILHIMQTSEATTPVFYNFILSLCS